MTLSVCRSFGRAGSPSPPSRYRRARPASALDGLRRGQRSRPAVVAICAVVLLFKATALTQESPPPKIDHILLEVADLKKSIAFYHDLLGLQVKSQSKDFAMLESGNVGVFLSSRHWDWDQKRPSNARPGWGMYPHFSVLDVAQTIERARKAGYRIAQEPRKYSWGTEAFVADPDGYVSALVNAPK